MANLETLPLELNFLKLMYGDRKAEYRSSPWLSTAFDLHVWEFDFGTSKQLPVNFRVRLEDGSLLTDESNRSLLDTFKCWICIQTHFDVTGGSLCAAETARALIRRALTLIDYFLINSEHFQLSKYGLVNVTENDLINLLATLASSRQVTTSIYQWPTRLSEFLLSELKIADRDSLNKVIEENPFIALDIPDQEDRLLTLSEEEIVYSRALLWKAGYYRTHFQKAGSEETFRFALNTQKLAPHLYVDTLRGYTKKSQPFELLLDPTHRYSQEFARAPVRHNTEDYQTESEWLSYRKTLRSLGQLFEIGLPVPLFALRATRSLIPQESFFLKSKKRYRTLPYNVVLDSLKNAVEFALSYGQDLLESAEAVIEAAQKANMSCVSFAKENDIKPLLVPKVRDMGVSVWHLACHMNSEIQKTHLYDRDRASSTEYFKRLRNNEGLFDLLRVFYGAVQLCVGTLMARRQSELIDLIAGKALDESKAYLQFFNRKSGVGDMREKEARPIPPVAVRLIELLEKFHDRLAAIGVSRGKALLFSYPDMRTGKPVSLVSRQYNASIDIFCDYTSTPINENGERYYIRQHQLRRFFAMTFFWGNSFGGMDALRWFLGHTDIEHLYHYITESTPGYVLRATKAHFGSELIKANPSAAPELAEIIEKKFGTREFTVLDSDELDDFVEELLLEGRVKIEPIFFDGPDGKSYRIAIRTLTPI